MKTAKEWNQDILKITMKISQEFPELFKYIKEMPLKVASNDTAAENIKALKDYYNSLSEIVTDYSKTHTSMKNKNNKAPLKDSGYPLYPASDDIYNQEKEVRNLNPEDLSKNKAPNEKPGSMNEKDFEDDMSGDDLDVPGSELDDQQEIIGSEDEENNYYSLGGDAHNDLDEDKG